MHGGVLGMSLCDREHCTKIAIYFQCGTASGVGTAYCAEHMPRVVFQSPSAIRIDAETLAARFHETYERLAPEHGYKTREASAVAWQSVPENNKHLMIAVSGEILAWLKSSGLFVG